VDETAALIHDPVDGGQPETALADVLSREERLEQALLRLLAHAAPRVADRDGDELRRAGASFAAALSVNITLAVAIVSVDLRHLVARVDDEVDEHRWS
jgi:hypothetical protein